MPIHATGAVLILDIHHEVSIPWDAEEYTRQALRGLTGLNDVKEARAVVDFPPLYQEPFPEVTTPCTVQDCAGRILIWYLPGVLTPERQVCDSLVLLLLTAHNMGTDNIRVRSGQLAHWHNVSCSGRARLPRDPGGQIQSTKLGAALRMHSILGCSTCLLPGFNKVETYVPYITPSVGWLTPC